MRSQTNDPLPRALEKARERFEVWRAARAPREKIPEKLWKLAVRTAEKHGAYKTARTLRLDYMALKRRIPAAESKRREVEAEPRFVEVTPAGAPSAAGCVAWVDAPAGGRLHLDLRGLGPAEIAAFARSFAGGER